ncbi:MAG: extracellular solute-binding protein [Rhodothermaceae bacterium]|nr:extracellular solute-binding protein [Rhodothermaceae bacterium]
MRRLTAFLALLLVLPLVACTSDSDPEPTTEDDGPLVIYSGRKDVLVDPLVERFRAATGLDVEVRYGSDAELIAALEEEGDASPADVFWANTAGALGAAAEANLLTTLPDSLLAMPDAFVPSSGRWVPVTVRFRVMAYSPARADTAAFPASVLDLPDDQALRGRIGWTPTYSSFLDFVTALRETEGEAAARTWLNGIRTLDPKAYASNTPMLEALQAGEIDVALTNHYYVLRVLQDEAREAGDEPPIATYHFGAGDAGNLALVTGAGLLTNGGHRRAAQRFLRFLLSPEAQAFAAEEVHEYPVTRDVTVPDYFLPFDEAVALSPAFDSERLRAIEATTQLLRELELQ